MFGDWQDDWEEYYLVKTHKGKHHIVERPGKVRAMCGADYRFADGYIKGRAPYLALFMSLGNLTCVSCKNSLKRKLDREREDSDLVSSLG